MTAAAIVLLSGGIDSAVALASLRAEGVACEALLVDYGQRHGIELARASALADYYETPVTRVSVNLPAMRPHDALIGQVAVPKHRSLRTIATAPRPATFVPGRNLVLLSLAFSLAAMRAAGRVVMGVTLSDAAGYADCRPRFVTEFAIAARCGTETFVQLDTPWLYRTKGAVIAEGARLGVDFAATLSCYQPGASGTHCGCCDACVIRRHGFVDAGIVDPTIYEAP